MLQEFQDPTVETGLTNQLIEDVPPFREHPFIMQARTFIKNGTPPIMYYEAVRQSLPKVPGVEHRTAMRLLADIELALINSINDEFKASNEDRAGGNTRAVKPADLWRKYHKVLQLIVDRGRAITQIHAESLLQDLYCEQTQSEGDLQNPDYIDAYTGEIEVDSEVVGDVHECVDKVVQLSRQIDPRKLLKAAIDYREPTHGSTTAISNSHKEVLQWAIRLRKDLKWDDDTLQQFVDAQMDGYDAESDDIPLLDDDIDPYTPPTLIPNDLVLDRELWYSAREDVWTFNRARSEIFIRMQIDRANRKAWRNRFSKMKHDTPRRKHWWKLYWRLRDIERPHKSWHAIFRKRITATDAWCQIIYRIREVATEDVITAATIYLTLAGDYGLMEKDVADIRGLYQLPEQYYKAEDIAPGARIPLVSFANEWEEDLLNLAQDAMSPTSETNPHAYQDVLMDIITTDEDGDIKVGPAPIRAIFPTFDHNPVNTAAYNIGFMRAATAKTTWKQAEDAGWANWRREMSEAAAAEYDMVFAQTKDCKKAMAAFWRVCPREVPRPKDIIKNIDATKTGLNLTSGRFISWNVAKLKMEKDEIQLTRDIKVRLLEKLRQLKCGQAIWSLLK